MNNLKRIFGFMGKYRFLYLLGIFSIFISQIFIIFNPMILQTTIDSIFSNKEITNAYMDRLISFLGTRDYLRENIWILALVLLLASLIRGVFLFLRKYLTGLSSEVALMNLRNKIYDHIQRLDYDYHVKSETGELIQRATSDVEVVRRFLSIQLVDILSSFFMILVVIITMSGLNRKMTLASMALLPISFLSSILYFTSVKKDFRKLEEIDGRLNTSIQENLTGIRVVKAFNRQDLEIKKFLLINKDHRDASYKVSKNMAIYWGVSDFISMTQVGIIIVYGGILASRSELSLGEFTAFSTFINLLVWPVRQLGRSIAEMGKAFVSLDRIFDILDLEIEDLNGGFYKPKIKGEIQFKDLSFSYGDKLVLNKINFHLKAGQSLAILGPTGSGKSSLVKLLQRLYDYQEGSILLDGNEVSGIDKAWLRSNIGLILQEPYLYSKTIKENIRLVDPTREEENVLAASKTAHIHGDIMEFSNKYDTLLGEKGSSISGGQKQRLSIARTIINDYPILIFDDSLSAVDTETDQAIRKSLKDRKNKSTNIIISHRISSAWDADLIIVLDKGRLVQSGSHSSLLKEEGLYKRLYEIQNLNDLGGGLYD